MPIKGLTDTVLPTFPRLGKLRKGANSARKTADGSQYSTPGPGEDLEYFRFVSERPDVQAAFDKFYTRPAMLIVYLPYDEVERNFQAWQEEWTAAGLIHRCDGETAVIWRMPDGRYSRTPKPCPYFENPGLRTARNPGCRPVGRLSIIIPELLQVGFVGYVSLETHSKHDIISIQASLLAVYEAAQKRNIKTGLRGIPFALRRVRETISVPLPGEGGKRVNRPKWLVKIEPISDWMALDLTGVKQDVLQESNRSILSDGRLLSTGDDEDREHGEMHDNASPNM